MIMKKNLNILRKKLKLMKVLSISKIQIQNNHNKYFIFQKS